MVWKGTSREFGIQVNLPLNFFSIIALDRQSPRPIRRARRPWAEKVERRKDLDAGPGMQLVWIVLKEGGGVGLEGRCGTLQDAHESVDRSFEGARRV